GASAPLAALIGSGFPLVPFTMFGFAPNRATTRMAWLRTTLQTPHTFSFFEAPHRIEATLGDLGRLSGNRPIVVARGLTKVHQEFLRGPADEVAEQLTNHHGEFTVIVGPANNSPDSKRLEVSDDEVAIEFGRITDKRAGSRREAVNELAKRYGRSAREIY